MGFDLYWPEYRDSRWDRERNTSYTYSAPVAQPKKPKGRDDYIQSINTLQAKLSSELPDAWDKQRKQDKIDALTDLNQTFKGTHSKISKESIEAIRKNHPLAFVGFFGSRVGRLLDEVEANFTYQVDSGFK